MSDETKLCANCNQHIAVQSFTTHELHCHRHLQLCDKCLEPVRRDQLEQHNDEHHKMVYCKQCGQHMENGVLSQHEAEECSKRKVKCTFCEVEVVVEEREHHQSYCGSRTEPCVKCGRRIMLLDQTKHDAIDCAFPPLPTPLAHRPSSPGAGNYDDWAGSISSREDDDGEDVSPWVASRGDAGCDAVTESTDTGHRHATVTLGESGLDAEFMLPCECCQKLFAPEQLEDHQNQCMAFDNTRGDVSPMFRMMAELFARGGLGAAGAGGGEGGDSEDDDGSLLPCEQCGKSFAVNKFILHQSACKPPEDDFRHVGIDSEAQSKHTNDNLQSSATNVSMIPCEFCSEFYPEDVLYSHQGSCDAYRGNRNRQNLFHDLVSEYRGNTASNSKPPFGGSKSATGYSKAASIIRPQSSANDASKSIFGVTLPPFGGPVPGPAVRLPLILHPLPSDDLLKSSGSREVEAVSHTPGTALAASYIPAAAPAMSPPLILPPTPYDHHQPSSSLEAEDGKVTIKVAAQTASYNSATAPAIRPSLILCPPPNDHHQPSSSLVAEDGKMTIKVAVQSEEPPSSSPALAEKYYPTSPSHEEAKDAAKAEGVDAHLIFMDSKQREGSPQTTLVEEPRSFVRETLVSQPVVQSVSSGRRSEASARHSGKSAVNKYKFQKIPNQAKPQYVWNCPDLVDKYGKKFGVASSSNGDSRLKKAPAAHAVTKSTKQAALESGTLAGKQQPLLCGRDEEASVTSDMQATLMSVDDNVTADDH